MITTVVTVTSTFLAGSFGAAAVAALILFLIMRELTSAHAEESGSMRSKILSHTLLVPISPLRDASTARVIFSTVGPRKRSTAWSAAPRVGSLRGFRRDRSGEPPVCRTRAEFPADDGFRLRVVRSTLHYATSARGDATTEPL